MNNSVHQSSRSGDSRGYASPGDFCRIFNEDMDSLYSLALALTQRDEIAEQCFVAALEDCCEGRAVFPEWARSWSRRTVIKNAIRLVNPAPSEDNGEQEAAPEYVANDVDVPDHRFIQLQPFERFVFVLSVLEGYAVRDCAALLRSGWREVEQAKVRALQQIAGVGRDLAPVPHVGASHRKHDPVLMLD